MSAHPCQCYRVPMLMPSCAHTNAAVCPYQCRRVPIPMLLCAHTNAVVCPCRCYRMPMPMLSCVHTNAVVCLYQCCCVHGAGAWYLVLVLGAWNELPCQCRRVPMPMLLCAYTCVPIRMLLCTYTHADAAVCPYQCRRVCFRNVFATSCAATRSCTLAPTASRGGWVGAVGSGRRLV